MRTFEDFLSVSVYCRDRMNPYLYVYALSVAILHRPDTQNLQLPPLSEIFPDKYLDGGIFSQARQEAEVVPIGSRVSHTKYNIEEIFLFIFYYIIYLSDMITFFNLEC